MGDTNPTTAANGGIDYQQLAQALGGVIVSSLKPALDELTRNQKIIADTLAQATPATAAQQASAGKPDGTASNPGGAGAGLTADDVKDIVTSAIKELQQTQTAQQQREQFIQQKLADLPAVYRSQLGNDPSKWAAEEQQIRQQYQADFKAAGGKPPAVNGSEGTANSAAPAQAVDLSKLNPVQKISLGLKSLPVPASINAATVQQLAGQQQQQAPQTQQTQTA